jgi:chemotaxis protein MotA
MNVGIGYLVAVVCIFGAYLIHGGDINVIIKALPTELMAIFGGSIGAFIVTNDGDTIKAVKKSLPYLFKKSPYNKSRYMDLLGMLYEILVKIRKEGLMSIEKDVEDPHSSAVFSKYEELSKDHHVMDFITDYLRIMVSGNLNAMEIENLMDVELETHHNEGHAPAAAITRLGDALPAFGIVAAVLGVVNTMGSVGQPPAVLGGMIGSALVGTFLGILLAYGFVGPLGTLMEQKLEKSSKELQCIKVVLLSSIQGYAPQIAVEFGRKTLFSPDRPNFSELEEMIKGKK